MRMLRIVNISLREMNRPAEHDAYGTPAHHQCKALPGEHWLCPYYPGRSLTVPARSCGTHRPVVAVELREVAKVAGLLHEEEVSENLVVAAPLRVFPDEG